MNKTKRNAYNECNIRFLSFNVPVRNILVNVELKNILINYQYIITANVMIFIIIGY